jgi:hypothetical protein
MKAERDRLVAQAAAMEESWEAAQAKQLKLHSPRTNSKSFQYSTVPQFFVTHSTETHLQETRTA